MADVYWLVHTLSNPKVIFSGVLAASGGLARVHLPCKSLVVNEWRESPVVWTAAASAYAPFFPLLRPDKSVYAPVTHDYDGTCLRQDSGLAGKYVDYFPSCCLTGSRRQSSREAADDQKAFFKIPARFGHVPVAEEPLGYDHERRFEQHYPRIELPFQLVDTVETGIKRRYEKDELFPNGLKGDDIVPAAERETEDRFGDDPRRALPLTEYVDGQWKRWADRVTPFFRANVLYDELYALHQYLALRVIVSRYFGGTYFLPGTMTVEYTFDAEAGTPTSAEATAGRLAKSRS